jgi:hypothetical protein
VRSLLDQVEGLSPTRFVLFIGAVGGVLQSIPVFFHGTTNVATARVGQIVLVLGIHLLWWTAAALLWWLAVQRNRFSIWLTALHVTLALALADLLVAALSLVAASIETHGEIVDALRRAPSTAMIGPFGPTLLRSPLWFVEALVLLALGRLVLRMDAPLAAAPSTSTPTEAVT